MEANPYAAPAAAIDDVAAWDTLDREGRKSGRGKRPRAVLLDAAINWSWILPIIWGALMAASVQKGIKPTAPMVGLNLFGTAILLALCVNNRTLLRPRGQTIGKRVLNRGTVWTHRKRMGLRRYGFIRVLRTSVLARVSDAGGLISRADRLMILDNARRRVDDLMVDTFVVGV